MGNLCFGIVPAPYKQNRERVQRPAWEKRRAPPAAIASRARLA
ncbi:hypothetical protein PY32053_01325 [Paracoccus yeei]|uniref:Uncharacterized protein n=1 Tax=Paracoccus yeei TaxID=147645 RepID=A0A386UM62_9RHOB|nr:hypothetical protein PY32053_01325 [Paracoccus yeei]